MPVLAVTVSACLVCRHRRCTFCSLVSRTGLPGLPVGAGCMLAELCDENLEESDADLKMCVS